jgi:hypothetical protein
MAAADRSALTFSLLLVAAAQSQSAAGRLYQPPAC